MALFEATGLHKRFGDQVVLQDLSLAFEEGRLSGIMGPNGAGKTTCFNVLTGRHPPDRGRVTFAGEDITGLSNLERKERLAALLKTAPQPIVYGDHVIAKGEALFDAICAEKGEGIIAKKAESPYRGARAKSWLKVVDGRGADEVARQWTRMTGGDVDPTEGLMLSLHG